MLEISAESTLKKHWVS